MDFIYRTISGGIEITGYTGTGGAVGIPYYISGRPVVSIYDGSFSNNSKITSVSIPNSVISIGKYAFSSCTELSSVSFGTSVESIGGHAFENCKLETVTLPDSLVELGDVAFGNCGNLTDAHIGNGISTGLGEAVFYLCKKLSNVTLPDSITTIPRHMFYSCHSLTTVPVGIYVTEIGESSFRYCNSLTNVVVPDTVTELGSYAFANCQNLTGITFGAGLTELPSNVCATCLNLVNVTIPNTITDIGQSAFGWCNSLEYLSIPDSVVTTSTSLCRDCPSLEEVVLGEGMTIIKSFTFYKCTAISKITVGSNVSSIEGSSFYKCNNLTELIFKGDVPETLRDDIFDDVPGPVYRYDSGSGWGETWNGLQVICLDCQYSSSSSSISSMGSSRGSSFSSSSSSGGSSNSFDNSTTSESSEIDAATLPFSIRGISWKSSGKVNGHLTAVSYPLSYQNRVSQTLRILFDRYEIERIAIYAGERRGSDSSYSVWLDIYETDSDGKPLTFLKSVSKPASDFQAEGWYFFDIALPERDAPEENMISVVFRQDGGDDLNCVPWYYSENISAGIDNQNVCYISSDETIWEEVPGISMSMKLINSIDMFSEAYEDTPAHVINTSPGDPATLTLDGQNYLSSGIVGSHNVKIVSSEPDDTSGTSGSDDNEDSLNRPYIDINHPKFITSLVVDGSGSMGWSDRRFGRIDIAKSISDLLLDEYPGESLIDIVRIGAAQIDELNYESSKTYSTIKIDLNNPENTVLNADGTEPSLSDGTIAYGLDDLETGNTYIVAKIFTEDVELEDGAGITDTTLQVKMPLNFTSFGDSTEDADFQILPAGPGSESGNGDDAVSSELHGNVNQIRRNIQVKRHLSTAYLTVDAEIGDFSIEVDDSSEFNELQEISICDANGTDPSKTISSIDGTTISVSEELLLDFEKKASTLGGIIQESVVGKTIDLSSSTTLELLIKDANVTRPINFYLETAKGGRLIWQILPFTEWEPLLLYYSDKGGAIKISGFDSENVPLPDGTEVQIYVDAPNDKFSVIDKGPFVIQLSNPPLAEGAEDIVLEDVSKVKAGDSITLLGLNTVLDRIPGFIVDSVDANLSSITIFPPYESSSFEVSAIEVLLPPEDKDEALKVFLPISAVDLTPSDVGREADPGALEFYDKPPTSSLNTDKNFYNQDSDFEIKLPTDLPVMWDSSKQAAVVSLRILPVTEDFVDTEAEKADKVVAATQQRLSDEEKALISALEDDYRIETETLENATIADEYEDSSFSVTDQTFPEDADYSIESPVLLFSGNAESFMQTFTSEMEVQREDQIGRHSESYSKYGGDENWEDSGLLARKYSLYPYILIKDDSGAAVVIKEMESFDIYFASPYQIWSNIGPSDKRVNYPCVFKTVDALPGEPGTTEGFVEIPGCYAASEEEVYIDYIVTNKGSLLKDGELLVKIFDANRNPEEIIKPESVTPDFSEELCVTDENGPSFDLNEQRAPFYSRREAGIPGSFLDRMVQQEASYLEGYSGTITVPIVNGRGRVTIKAPASVVAKLIFVAEFIFPEDSTQSVLKQDPFWFINPLEIKYMGSTTFLSGDDQPLYEIGATATYKGIPIPDNVPVEFESSPHDMYRAGQGRVISKDDPAAAGLNNFMDAIGGLNEISGAGAGTIEQLESLYASYGRWPATPLEPSVSKTIDGVARGVYLGTHGEVTNHYDTETFEQEGDTEVLSISASYNGFSVTKKQTIEWMGIDETSDFKFRIKLFTGNGDEISGLFTEVYADGWDSVYVLADLAATVQAYPSCEPYHDILLGKDRAGNPVGSGNPSWVIFMGAGYGFWQEEQPLLGGKLIGTSIDLNGETGRGYCLSIPLSQAKVISPSECDCTYLSACNPQGTLIDVSTTATIGTKKYNGFGCMSESNFSNDCESLVSCGDSFKTASTRPAAILWKEPLECELSRFGSAEFSVNRDGTPTEIMANVTFSGEAIPIVAKNRNAVDSEGKTPATPLVIFDIYKVVEEFDTSGTLIRRKEIRDDSLSLTDYSNLALVELTDSSLVGSEGHFHKCQVDNNGDGVTYSQYDEETSEEVPETHSHTISSYVVGETVLDSVAHSHKVKSIAKTTINPTNDTVNKICLKAKVSYDASKSSVERTVSTEKCDDVESETGWSLILKNPGEYVAKESTTITDDGFDLIAELRHSVDGVNVEIPDGTRIHFGVEVYLSEVEIPGASRRTVVFSSDEKRPYVSLNWIASAKVGEGEIVTAEAETKVFSEFSWIPNVRALVPNITSDKIFIDDALSSITTLGGSPIHDAINLAASRVINYRLENSDWANCYSCMALITDGDENLSGRTLDQGIKSVNRMGGAGGSSAVSVAMGRPHPADLLVLKKYAEETNGIILKVAESNVDGQDVAKKIFSEKLQEANSGTYRNTVDLFSEKLFKSIEIELYSPTGSSSTFRARFGEEKENLGDWSTEIEIPPSGIIDLSGLSDGSPHRFMGYEIVLTGNESFESPRIISISTAYIEPKRHTLIFSPISVDISAEEYIGEALITHKVTSSSNSTINYAIIQSDSLDVTEYFSDGQPLIGTNSRQILLGRNNELATSENRVTFFMSNGPWPEVTEIEVYRIIGNTSEFIPASGYSANPKEGSISFSSIQDAEAKLSVTLKFPPLIRVVCLITNYGEESVSIDHIGITYNKVQRIAKDEFGINRRPISDLYEISSSSSESES